MRTLTTRLALVGTLGLTAVTGGVLLGPALAGATPTVLTQVSEDPAAAEQGTRERPRATAWIREKLAGLVADATITPEQADAVAAHLAEQLPARGDHGRGPGARHLSLDVAADTLGVSEADLRAALRDGSSLADVAEQEDVALDTLVTSLVEAGQQRLDEAVADGRITQERADAWAAELPTRVEELVQREGLGHRGRGGPPAGELEPSSLGT